MKKFEELEQQAKAIGETKEKSDSVSLSFSPKILITIGLGAALIIGLCIFLFGNHGLPSTGSSNQKKYSVEIDGKEYSADTLEELDQMVGFDVSSFITSAENQKPKETTVEDRIFENGELANIGTEYGTYKWGVTKAEILPPIEGSPCNRDSVYQITWEVQNIDFDSGDGQGTGLYPNYFTVTDSDGYVLSQMTMLFDGDNVNEYARVAPGKKCISKFTYTINNPDCTYLDISLDARGVVSRIYIDNPSNGVAEKSNPEKLAVADINNSITAAKVGDLITFGKYEQDNNASNGKEDIEWLVLDKKDGKTLLISKYCLDCAPYNNANEDVTWETCSLRAWLNESFLNNAFSADEQTKIVDSFVCADNNPEYSTNPGNDTIDKVFLLSLNELQIYFTSDELRRCASTEYAKAQGSWTSDRRETSNGEATCWWWLRTPGIYQNSAAGVGGSGSYGCKGDYVYDVGNSVRPVIWISLG